MAHGLKRVANRGGISIDRMIACIGNVINGEDKESSILAEYESAKMKPPKNPTAAYQGWRVKILSEMAKENTKVIETCKAEGIYVETDDKPKTKRKSKAAKVDA